MSARAFSLVDGGPLCRLIRRLRWVRPDGRCDYARTSVVVVAATWVPLLIATVAQRLFSGRGHPIDWSVHTRLLVAIPLFFRAEASLDVRTRRTVAMFAEERWAPEQADRVEQIVAAAERLRDAVAPEVTLLVLALVASQAVVWHLTGRRATAQGLLLDPRVAVPRYWYALVALPVFQFLLYRSLWRWAIWARLLWRLSRLRLRPTATHPDLAGGLEFLSMPSVGFSYVVAALSATQASLWANRVLYAGAKIASFEAEMLVFTLAALLLALGPLVAFAGHLARCRFAGILDYDALATDYSRRFQARWIEQKDERSDLLGSADIQALADMTTSVDIVHRMRLIPFPALLVVIVAAAAVVPAIPVVLLELPLTELLVRIGGSLLGKGHG
jgi:hypothetical protein